MAKEMSTEDNNPSSQSRDNFSGKTRSALALRAAHRCAFRGCGIATEGPSDAGASKHVSIGVAAHIEAAARGGPRYNENMTPEQRGDISNGIWLCQTHSRIIDSNAAAYPPLLLQQMKAEHEQRISIEMTTMRAGSTCYDFVALGPSIVFVGELIAIEKQAWSFRVEHFVIGDLGELVRYIEGFPIVDPYDRFVLVNDLGDGRELDEPPTWSKARNECVITTKVKASAKRLDVHRLPIDLALGDDHDLVFRNGDLATVQGLDSLPQKLKLCLSSNKGDYWADPTFGTRIREYMTNFLGSPWLPRLIKLETIRMASIPFNDAGSQEKPATPLWCVRKVMAVDQVDLKGNAGWFVFHLKLDVEGLGEWDGEIPIFISNDLCASTDNQA